MSAVRFFIPGKRQPDNFLHARIQQHRCRLAHRGARCNDIIHQQHTQPGGIACAEIYALYIFPALFVIVLLPSLLFLKNNF